MDYGKLNDLIDSLQTGDNIKILAWDNIRIRDTNRKITQLASPFENEMEYAEYINSHLKGRPVLHYNDTQKNILIVFMDKCLGNSGAITIRKLKNV